MNMKSDKFERDAIIFAFLMEAGKELGEGKSKTFQCPSCGNQASASRSSTNGHLWARCNGCSIRIIS